jgi:hypothetical protein
LSFSGRNPGFCRYGAQILRFWEPPPVDRQLKVAEAYVEQYVPASARPTAVTTAVSQLRKQYCWPVDSKGPQSCGLPSAHSPGIVQQSASEVQVCVQYPPCTLVRQVTSPDSPPASIPA